MIIRARDASSIPVNHKGTFDKNVIVSNGVVPGLLQCATVVLREVDVIESHLHESMTEIFYILSGELSVSLDSVHHSLTQGDSFVVFPGVMHGIAAMSEAKLFYFNIESDINEYSNSI